MAEPAGTASRLAALGRPQAVAVALLLALALAAAIWEATALRGPAAAAVQPVAVERAKSNADLQLYDAIVDRIGAGEGYYSAAAAELRAGNYPLKPFVAFRLPTLAVAAAWIGRPALQALQYALFAAMVAAWWYRLEGQFADKGRRISAAMLAAAGIAVALSGKYLLLHEVWAGTLVALSLALHRQDRWGWSVAAAALALAIRELALPYLLLMAAFALYRRNWRELAAWTALVLLFAVAMAWHAGEVAKVVLPSDPPSPGWATLAGWPGLLRTFHLAGPLRWLPMEIGAAAIVLALLGWASWKSKTGLAATLMYLGYGVAFMLFGRANNFYWGLMVTPAFLIGLAFLPQALTDLAAAARRPAPTS
ncbi:MAG TPA: hypothetical protein VNJ05_05290 [Sphingomicrobium sp.]|nr:hypothetical protein [Sphingomicrobium sp.]